MMTTEEWNDKPRGREYGAEPEFDAHGWCHDMSAAPRDGTVFLVSWPVLKVEPWSLKLEAWFVQAVRWHDTYKYFVLDYDDDYEAEPFRAWRPLPLPPVMEQDE